MTEVTESELAGISLTSAQVEAALAEYANMGMTWPQIEAAYKADMLTECRQREERRRLKAEALGLMPGERVHVSRKVGEVETVWIEGTNASRGCRMVHGIASTPAVNSHNYALESKNMRCRLPVPLLSSHSKFIDSPIGRVVFVRKSPVNVYVRAVIHDGPAGDYAWELLQDGTLSAFSAAASAEGLKLDGEVEGVRFYSEWILQEVSLCPLGACPGTCVEPWFETWSPRCS